MRGVGAVLSIHVAARHATTRPRSGLRAYRDSPCIEACQVPASCSSIYMRSRVHYSESCLSYPAMSSRRRRKKRLYTKCTELAFAVPQVISHRLLRLAASGHKPSARDRREFDRMITEKAEAMGEAWGKMTVKAFQANQELALSLMKSWMRGSPAVVRQSSIVRRAASECLSAGIAPVHRRATANARRLAKIKTRKR
jgi:hypothetical protein